MDDKDRERLAALFFATDPRIKDFLKDRGELACGVCGEKKGPRVIANEAQAEETCEHRREAYWKTVDLAFNRDELGAKTDAFKRVDEMERLRAAGLRRKEGLAKKAKLESNAKYGKGEKPKEKLHAQGHVKADKQGTVTWADAFGIHSVRRVERGVFDVLLLEPLPHAWSRILVRVDRDDGIAEIEHISDGTKRVRVREIEYDPDGVKKVISRCFDAPFSFQMLETCRENGKSNSVGASLAPLRETLQEDSPRVLGMGKGSDEGGVKLGDLVSSRTRRIAFPNDVGEIVGGGAHESQHGLVRVRWRSNGDLMWLPTDGLRKISE